MGWSDEQLHFQQNRGVLLDNYVVNGEWEIVASNLTIIEGFGLAGFRVEIEIQRRSGFFILNIVMPVVLLSFLNITVFLIPVESGEKISYGITVLLALAVFMSIVGEMLPRSSDVVPLVTIYLFVLLIISVLTVMVAIIIVWLHHKDEEETKRQKATTTFKNMFRKVRVLNRATTPLTKVKPSIDHLDTENVEPSPAMKINQGASLLDAVKKLGNPEKVLPPVPDEERRVNRYKLIGRHIDTVAFFIFTVIWLSVTLGFTLVLST
ncbi:neuronal acetylcholine receptor subunit alpha-7 [Elysia marginata]|uniref:Neuronal acetylcholine receptor subunit alpha-7 n=1 Tax=Elysia marginata TaxID=1093978 RepID=A0AAV4GL14_9GAST|nr:neuronal acetylcholine receptor subunit alpha-7 [Elysia marginata]